MVGDAKMEESVICYHLVSALEDTLGPHVVSLGQDNLEVMTG